MEDARIPVWATVKAAYRVIFDNFGKIALISAIFIVLDSAATELSFVWLHDPPETYGADRGLGLASLLVPALDAFAPALFIMTFLRFVGGEK